MLYGAKNVALNVRPARRHCYFCSSLRSLRLINIKPYAMLMTRRSYDEYIVDSDDYDYHVVRCYYEDDICFAKERFKVDSYHYDSHNAIRLYRLARMKGEPVREPALHRPDGTTDITNEVLDEKDDAYLLRTTYDSAGGRVVEAWLDKDYVERLCYNRVRDFKRKLRIEAKRQARIQEKQTKELVETKPKPKIFVTKVRRRGRIQRENIQHGPCIKSKSHLGSGLEDKVWPAPRPFTMIASKASKDHLSEVTKIEMTRSRCTIYVTLKTAPNKVFPVEHYKYWEFSNARDVLHQYFKAQGPDGSPSKQSIKFLRGPYRKLYLASIMRDGINVE